MSSEGTPHVIECPECQARLKLRNAPTPGKKILCPKCQVSFIVPEEEERIPTAKAVARKPAPPPAEEEEQEEERPVKPKLKKKKKKSGSGPWLGIGLSVGGLLLVGAIWGLGAIFWPYLFGSQHETSIKAIIGLTNEMATILESVKDESSAQAAAPKIVSIATKMKELSQRIKELPKIRKGYDELLTKKYEGKLTAAAQRLIKASTEAGLKGGRDPSFREAINKMRMSPF